MTDLTVHKRAAQYQARRAAIESYRAWKRAAVDKSAAELTDTDRRLVGLATRMMRLHGSFTQRGLAGLRDDDDHSVPLLLAQKAMAMLKEHGQ